VPFWGLQERVELRTAATRILSHFKCRTPVNLLGYIPAESVDKSGRPSGQNPRPGRPTRYHGLTSLTLSRRPLPAANRLDRSKERSRHLAREVCRVVRASHAVVMRDLWIGAEWPCHVDMVVVDSRCDQSIGRDSGLAPTLQRSHPVSWLGPGPPPQCSMPGTMKSHSQSCCCDPIFANTLE
jgi:hypothetical protein